ncbi:hypothetical protein H6G97_20485 [Nostoc flagelliforme FACHB-838]|uniref:Uncharacterized protein n=1 Tax=Nostoc flagelliforme FACHB-838 TaxID=2692904 RepID=A0ABR8DRI1_9NOSO|nr:hypothetical protein [Nostoc flagelliforme]MBD2531833.1 hypothetical protein [Nostoc flagelliforme FACHB-838]
MSEISTTGKTRETEPLGEQLFAIGDKRWKGEKVIARADEFTLGQTASNREY